MFKVAKFVSTEKTGRYETVYTDNPIGFYYRRNHKEIKSISFRANKNNSWCSTTIEITYTDDKFLRFTVWGKYRLIKEYFMSKKNTKHLVLENIIEYFTLYVLR